MDSLVRNWYAVAASSLRPAGLFRCRLAATPAQTPLAWPRDVNRNSRGLKPSRSSSRTRWLPVFHTALAGSSKLRSSWDCSRYRRYQSPSDDDATSPSPSSDSGGSSSRKQTRNGALAMTEMGLCHSIT